MDRLTHRHSWTIFYIILTFFVAPHGAILAPSGRLPESCGSIQSQNMTANLGFECTKRRPGPRLMESSTCQATIDAFEKKKTEIAYILTHKPTSEHDEIQCPYVKISGDCGLLIDFAEDKESHIEATVQLKMTARMLVHRCVGYGGFNGGRVYLHDRLTWIDILQVPESPPAESGGRDFTGTGFTER